MALFNEDAQNMQRQAVGVGSPQGYRMNPTGGRDRFAPPSNGGINPGGMYTPRPDGGPPPMGNPYDPGRMSGGDGVPPPYGGQTPGNGNPGWIPGPYGMPHNQGPLPPTPGPMRPIDPRNPPIYPPPSPGEQPPIGPPAWQGQHGNQMPQSGLFGGNHPAPQHPQTQMPIDFANGFNNPNAQQGGAWNGQTAQSSNPNRGGYHGPARPPQQQPAGPQWGGGGSMGPGAPPPQRVLPQESPIFPSQPVQQNPNGAMNAYLKSF